MPEGEYGRAFTSLAPQITEDSRSHVLAYPFPPQPDKQEILLLRLSLCHFFG